MFTGEKWHAEAHGREKELLTRYCADNSQRRTRGGFRKMSAKKVWYTQQVDGNR